MENEKIRNEVGGDEQAAGQDARGFGEVVRKATSLSR
jgi:hypothetical protein